MKLQLNAAIVDENVIELGFESERIKRGVRKRMDAFGLGVRRSKPQVTRTREDKLLVYGSNRFTHELVAA